MSLLSVYSESSPTYIVTSPDHQKLHDQVVSFLIAQLCTTKQAGCAGVCCRQINRRQHEAITWISPVGNDYSVQDLDLVFKKVCFTLQRGLRHFFVFEHSERFNQATANQLLKLFEEPPVGYVFIMMTTNIDRMLVTIKSRSIIVSLAASAVLQDLHPLLAALDPLKQILPDPGSFDKILQEHKPSPRESVELVEQFVQYLHGARKTNNDLCLQSELDRVITHAVSILKTPPQAGGSNMFWRQLFMGLFVGK